MASGVSINITGLNDVRLTLAELQSLPKEALPKVLTEAGAILLNRVRTRFMQQLDPNGLTWPVSQAAEKRALGAGGGTLFDTGRLFRSITLKKGRNPLERIIFTDVPYAKYHQFGTQKLPQRIFLGFSQGDITVLERLVNVRVREALRGFSG